MAFRFESAATRVSNVTTGSPIIASYFALQVKLYPRLVRAFTPITRIGMHDRALCPCSTQSPRHMEHASKNMIGHCMSCKSSAVLSMDWGHEDNSMDDNQFDK